jgi:large subunit ribosomal protein L5
MATKDKKQGQQKQGQQKQGQQKQSGKKQSGGERQRAAAVQREHAGVGTPPPPPRLRTYYETAVRERLRQQFSLQNVHQIPTLEKIVINVGVGEAVKQPRLLDSVVEELEVITGQRPIRTRAKRSISNFSLREGQEIGASVTLRGTRMWEFLDRFISVAIPRIRDFRGLGTRSFDGRGNYSLGLKEQVIFPEINYDRVEQVHGMDVTFVTSTDRDDQAFALLRELGMPFRGDEKPVVVQF